MLHSLFFTPKTGRLWLTYLLAQVMPAGLQVLEVLAGDNLISLTWVPVQFTQSVIPIGAILFMLCQVLSLPNYWRLTASGISLEHAEIEEEVETELEKNKDRA